MPKRKMSLGVQQLSLGFAFIFWLFSCSPPEDKLIIATAANMQYAMVELIDQFEADYGIDCEMVVGSSGKLTAQALAGAPFDVLLSADMIYPQKIEQEGKAALVPVVYAEGQLVLWSKSKVPTDFHGTQVPRLEGRIAIPNPEIAPYGRAAMEIFERAGVVEDHREQFVFGESISQTNQYMISGAVDWGFTSKSSVLSEEMKGVGRWIEFDPKLSSPIEQGVVILNNRPEQMEKAQLFLDFLNGGTAREILITFGYSVPDNELGSDHTDI